MTALPLDRDAVLWSASTAELADRPLLVLLHGYGSHEGDLFGLSPYLPLGPVVASLRAPIALQGGHAWFPIVPGSTGDPDPAAADAAAQGVLDWLDGLPAAPRSVGLLGFSQGGATALQLLRLAPGRFTYAVQLSGFSVRGEHAGDAALAADRTPVFWGRGTADQVIPDAAVARTRAWIGGHTDLTERIYEDLPHSVSAPELRDVSAFIREHAG
ncbi:putative hydrolase [Clavibacter michiganensis]|uniref:Putative hydrolase n=1 Tax=Clavibacter michiganensis TaxID=28447 RepID=A0A251XXF8_9MICO|nr:putative hydrolase [Clavibacter michiganensis]